MKKLYKLLLICLLIIAGGGNALKAQSYNSDNSETANRAETPTYISKIAVAYGAEASTPKNILNNQGFTIIDYDLNKGCGSTSHYIYMGYKTTTNPADAITGIFFRTGKNPPDSDTFDGVTAYLLGGSDETNPGENTYVDLNADAGGQYIYTYVTRNTSRAAVINGMYFDGNNSASGYVTPDVNLNSGTNGGAIYLHYKQFSGKASATFHYLNSSGSRTSSTTSVSVKHHQQAVNNTPSAPTSVTYDGRTWTLLGWREDNNATTAGSNPSYTYMDSKVYRAVYSADVSLTYNANGGSNAPSKQTAKQYVNAGSSSIAKSNTSFTIPSTTPTHDATKCNFAGWGTSSSSTTAQYQAGGSISINTNTTLYAVWPEHNGTKSYVNNGSNHTYTWSCCEKSVTEDHIYNNGIDNYCGAHIHEIDGNGYCHLCDGYPAELVNGYYEIYNADNLFWFAEYVNTIDRTASAKLMNDIDLENRPWTPIGTTGESSHNFRGHFDGNGKTITGLNVEVTRSGGGFFGEVRLGTVEDFTIYGEVKLNGNHSYVGGVIGSAPGANSNQPEHNGATIRNITSYVNVTLGEGSHGSNRVAGFIGYANHETLIENCTWYGTLDLGPYRAQDGVGGLVGKANDNSEITIRNCAAYGTIKTSYQSGSYNSHNSIYIGGIVSNSVASAQTTLENCIWAGTLVNNTDLGSNAHISAIGTLDGIKSVSNCYALNNMPYITTNNAHNEGITEVTAGQLASGEIAYKLQGTQATQIWGQNIDNGETADSKPILGGAKVYKHTFDVTTLYSNSQTLTAGGKCGDNLYWKVSDNTLTIFGTGAMYDYGSDNNKAPWRSLNPAPKSLVLEEGITHIANSAFHGCSSFTGSLTIPNSVITIGVSAFDNCPGFTGSLTIPNNVTSIGKTAFWACKGFTGSLTIPNSVTTIGDYAFQHCDGFTGSLTIPNSVTTIGSYAFSGCSGFSGNLTIPNSVTTIGSYAFSGCSGFTGSLTIPNSVTSIGYSAFYYCSGFKGDLTIPNSVTTIGSYAFSGCSGFSGNLTIPNSVTTIRGYAFWGCSGFSGNLTIPNSVTTIGNYAFYNCSGFKGSLTIPNSVTSIGKKAFSDCSGFTGSLTIPNSVTSIGESAFENCSGFTGSLTIPNSVTTIGNSAFSSCKFSGSLTIPNSVTSIGKYAFRNCIRFTEVYSLAETAPTLGTDAFANINVNATLYYLASSVQSYNEKGWFNYFSKRIGLFGGKCGDNLHWYIDDTNTLTIFGTGTMYDYDNIDNKAPWRSLNPAPTSLVLEEGITHIGNYAFYGCDSFTEVHSSAVIAPTLGTDAFANINENAILYHPVSSEPSYKEKGWFEYFLQHVGADGQCGDNLYWYVDDENILTIFGTGAMYDYGDSSNKAPWRSLNLAPTSLVLEEGITHIGKYAFYKCSGFTGSLTIPNSVTTINLCAFEGCSGFSGNLTIPNSVTTIGDYAFFNCSGFNGSLTIPNSVTTIGNYAFMDCSGFSGNLTIPNSVTTIGNAVFLDCSGFSGNLTIPNSVTTIGNYAFMDCSGFSGNLTIPNSVTSIGREAFSGCSGFKGSLTIGNSVTSIGNSAFMDCSGFTEVYSLAKTAPTLGTKVFTGTNSNAILYYPVLSKLSYEEKGWFNYFPQHIGLFDGKCGDNLYWVVNDNVLTIFGTGAMYDYDNIDNKAPWRSLNPAPTSLVLEEGITTIGNAAFYGCDGFIEVHSSAVIAPTLGTEAFANINENAILYHPVSSEPSYEGKGWFEYFRQHVGADGKCGDNLYWDVDDENILTIFGTGAMYDYGSDNNKAPWRSLNPAPTSLILEEGITHIGNSAFHGCSSFNGSLTIPNSVTTIGISAFDNCGFTGDLTIPNNVTSIGKTAFWACKGFTGSLTIPNSVTSIGDYAFQYCDGFTGIFFYRDANPTIGSDAFSSINANAKVYAPVIWESFSNIPSGNLVKMATFVGQQTTDNGQQSSSTGWVFPEGMTGVGADDHVAINAPMVISGQQSAVSSQQSANSLSVKSFGLCGNGTTVNGRITIEDGGQLYCEIANGEVTVKKEILGYQQSESESKWYTIASPLKDAIQITHDSTLLTPNSDYDLYRYDEPSYTWQNAKNSANNGFNTIDPGRGYLYANAKNTTLEFKGDINTETVTYNLTAKSDVLKGFHLVGNPFTHDIYLGEAITVSPKIIFELNDSYGDGWTGNALKLSFSNGTPEKIITMGYGNSETETISVATGVTVKVSFMKGDYQEDCSFTIKYDDGEIICGEYSNEGSLTSVEDGATLTTFTKEKDILVNGYYTLTGEGAWAAEASTTKAIKPMQSILVKSLVDDYELKIYNTSNQPSAVSRQRSGKGQQTTDNGQQSLCISVSNAKYSDRAFVVFDKGVGLDKMNHENENIPLLYIPMEDADYAIAMMDINVNEIPVNFETNVMGEYTISLRQENCEFDELYLLDKETDEKVNILEQDYTFIATSNDAPERFVLLMNTNGQEPTANSHFAYINNGDIVIYNIEGDADIKIFDALGRCVYHGESSDETTRIANGYSSGVYMIQKVDDNGVKVQKIIL